MNSAYVYSLNKAMHTHIQLLLTLIMAITGRASMIIDLDTDYSLTNCELYHKNQEMYPDIIANYTNPLSGLMFLTIQTNSILNTTMEMTALFNINNQIYNFDFTCFSSETTPGLELLCKTRIQKYLQLPEQQSSLFSAYSITNTNLIIINTCIPASSDEDENALVNTLLLVVGILCAALCACAVLAKGLGDSNGCRCCH